MANVERFGLFYAPWPVIDGKPINYQWGEIRHDTAETKAIVRNSFQELQDGQEELNAIRALLGQAYGDIAFSNRYRFYYNKSTLEFCLQKNDGTVAVPVWTDVWCIRLTDGQLQVVSSGGVFSEAGFYGPDLERIYQIGESGSSAGDESFLHRSKLFFNVDDGFELNEITSGGNQGGVEVRLTFPIGRAVEFPKVGKEWVVQHDFGISPVLVQVMNDDKKIIIPDTADVSDPNIAYFYFNEVTSGSVYIASGGVGATSLLPIDPFYLVVRTPGQGAPDHTFVHNCDMVFDSRFFYVNVDLDPSGGGSHKSAFISFIPGTQVVIAHDENITVHGDIVGLQKKLTGMEAFYFKNGDEINSNDSIEVKSNTNVALTAAEDVNLTATDDVNISGAGGITMVASGGNLFTNIGGSASLNSVDDTIITTTDSFSGIHLRTQQKVAMSVNGGGSNEMEVGHDGVAVLHKVKAETFYFNAGGWIATYGLGEYGIGFNKNADSIFISESAGQSGILAKSTDPAAGITLQSSGGGSHLQALFPDGSVTFPSLAGLFDQDTGWYWDIDNTMGFSCGGTYQMLVGPDGLRVRDKVRANAFYNFSAGELLVLEFNRNNFYLTPKKSNVENRSVRVVNISGNLGGGAAKYAEVFASSGEWIVNHGLGTNQLVWSTYDNRDLAILPEKVDMTSSSIAYFYWVNAQAGRVVLVG